MKRKKTITVLIDDIDGTPDAETVAFAFNGTRYEIELAKENRAALKEALAPYIKKARKIGPKPKKKVADGPDPKEVRAWAGEAGVEVNPTGRVPESVVDQFNAAQQEERLAS